MPTHKTLEITKSQLFNIVVNLSDNDIIDTTAAQIISMTWIDLFYTVLLHSTHYLEEVRNDIPDLEPNLLAHNHRFLRVQRLVNFIHDRPPLRYHIKLIKKLADIAQNYGLWTTTQQKSLGALQDALHDYLVDITPMVIKATTTETTLKKYLGNTSRFYLPTTDPSFDEVDFETADYEAYKAALDNFLWTLDNRKTDNDLLTYLFRSDPYPAVTHDMDELKIPLIANYLPPSMKKILKPYSRPYPAFNFENYPPGVLPSAMVTNSSLEGNQFTYKIEKHQYESAPSDSVPPGAASSGFRFPGDENGMPNDPSDGPPTQSQGDNETGTNTGNDGTNTTGNPDPNVPVPPPQPLIPDDDGYEPNSVLMMKAWLDIKEALARPVTDMTHDHMTRFSTGEESPRNLSRLEVQGTDLLLLKGKSKLDGLYVITFTRKSRKPIFNSVVTN